ncbi:DUF1659 domain-containing protein [Lentibacillus sp. N15]|uniref:DUF1659 domain-containing protein n=1 Tax=Lentibacillus songyuanensis TaxID=3136161 RepID=UPI0031BACE40
MAVAELTNSVLQIVLDDGPDLMTGKQVYKTKSFNNIKPEATADQLYTLAHAFAGLQERPLYDIARKDSSQIVEE